LITTAVADDATQSTATIYAEEREETLVVRPGDAVATEADAVPGLDGGVAFASDQTILDTVGPGWARFERGDERWTVEITPDASAKPDFGHLVAILSDSSLSPGEKAERLLDAKRGIAIRENFISEASFAPRFDEDGEMSGLYVRSVVDEGVYARMGLEGGDVLLGVDGVVLDRPEASEVALAAFESSTSLRITRERAGIVENVFVQRAPKNK